MLILLIQIIGTIATAIIAIILLQKDWRTKNEAIRRDTVLVTKIIYAVSVVSILNLAISYFQSQSEIGKLEKDKRQLQVTIANLSFDVSKPAAVLSDQGVSYKKVPDNRTMAMNEPLQSSPSAVNKAELKKQMAESEKPKKRSVRVNAIKSVAANRTRNIKDEFDEVPLFHFVSTGRRVLSGVLVSKDDKPIYNLSVRVTNYDDLLHCRCFINNTDNTNIGTLNTLSAYSFKLPEFKRRAQNGRYLITLRYKNKVYYEEAIYAYAGHRHFSQALRIKEYEGSLLVHNTIVRGSSYQLNYVNWDRGFPLSIDEQSRKAYIAAN